MPTKLRNKTPAEKFDILDLLIAIFHLSGPKLISRSTGCQMIIDSRIGRICNILKKLSEQKRFAVFFKNCRFYHYYRGQNGDWYDNSVFTSLWSMEMSELITEINIANRSSYILLKKLHFQGEIILKALTANDRRRLRNLSQEFIKLLKEGETDYE
ncbi:MAG: hypothetical protein WCT16_01960 [Candidatus Buchananbacteria bacterium]